MNNKQRRLLKKIARTERIVNEHKLMVARGEKYLKYLKEKNKDIIKDMLNILEDKLNQNNEIADCLKEKCIKMPDPKPTCEPVKRHVY